MASLQSITVEYVVSGSLDGVTAAPRIVIDESAEERTAFDPDTQIYRVEVENLGIIDPDLGVGGSIGPRCIPFMWIDTEELGAVGASVDVVGVVGDDVKLQVAVEQLDGDAGGYLDDGFMVPQGSAIRVSGFAAGAEPIIVRVSILVPASCSDFALAALTRTQPEGKFGIGGMAFTGNLNGVSTVIVSPNVFVPVGNMKPPHPSFTLDPSDLFEIALSPAGSPNETQFQRLRYKGKDKVCAAISCSLSVQEPGVGAVGYAAKLTKNGLDIPNSEQEAQTGGLITSADSLSVAGGTFLEEGDEIGIEVANATNTADLVISSCHIQAIALP